MKFELREKSLEICDFIINSHNPLSPRRRMTES